MYICYKISNLIDTHSLCSGMYHVALFAYPVKLNISSMKHCYKTSAKEVSEVTVKYLSNAIKKILDNIFCFIGTLKFSMQYVR